MATFLSPGVNVSEIDLTTIVPSVSTSVGAIAGLFRWGPVGERVLVDSETILVQKFGKPTNFNAETFFTAANFLSYTNALYVSRAANTSGAVFYNNFVTTANSSVSNNIFVCSNASVNLLSSALKSTMYITQTTNTGVAEVNLSVVELINTHAVRLSSNVNIDRAVPVTYNITANTLGVTNADKFIKITNASTYLTVNDMLYYRVPTGNTAIPGLSGNTHYFVTFTNSTGIAVSTTLAGSNATLTAGSGSETHIFDLRSSAATLYFGYPETSYTALGLEPNAYSSNLINQIVTNENDYTVTEGNFDAGVTWVAKYPGAIGNSLKVSVVDNAASYSSNVTLSNTGYTFAVTANTLGVTNGSDFIKITSANTYLFAGDSVF
jgi:hypothetical protein